jgi:hypothetical protein
MAALAAIAGVLGAVSGVGGIQTGTSVSSHSTLSPMQQLWMMQMFGPQSARMPGYFSTLGKLGQNEQNPASSLPDAQTSFYGGVKLPMLQRQQQQMRQLTQDPSHTRINNLLGSQMREQNMLSINQMNSDFMNKARILGIQGADAGLNNQLQALGQMKGQFWQPMGVQMMENYYNPGVSPGGVAAAGAGALGAISSIYQNYQLQDLLNQMGNQSYVPGAAG